MANAFFTVPKPYNEPVCDYVPGSPQRQSLQAELERQKAEVVDIPLVIGGKHIYTDAKVDVTCPHDHARVIARCSQAEPEHIHAAVEASVAAQKKWTSMPWNQRAAVFLKAADLITGPYRDAINAATMLGQSKTAHQAEIEAACELADFLRFNAHYMQEIYRDQPLSPAGTWNRVEARGLEGFVYAIAPFNFTAISVNLAAAPAQMGCGVVWKPAPTAVRSSWLGMQILEEAGLPAGVINFLPGDPVQISEIVLNHPSLAGIHFTGSTATFNLLWNQVGSRIGEYNTYPRIVGETGGKDFIFAHPSADVDTLVPALIRGAYEYQGQKCSAASRAYVPKSLWPEVKKRLVETINGIGMGDISDFSNFMGAVIDQRSFKKIKGYIDGAKGASDAEVIAGGECDDSKGYFVRPTLIETDNPKYATMVEEIFGPVLTVYPYDDSELEATIDLCDTGTRYALTGAIFAKDRYDIDYLTARLANAAGNFYVNDKCTGAVVGQQPFGGARASGTNDKAGSALNLTRWMSYRTIKETFVAPKDYRYPYMGES